MQTFIYAIAEPAFLTWVILIAVFIVSIVLYVYVLEDFDGKGFVRIITFFSAFPMLILSSLLLIVMLFGTVFTLDGEQSIDEIKMTVANFEYLHESKAGNDIELSIVEKDSLFTNFFAVAWNTSLEELNTDKETKAFKAEYEKLCDFNRMDCYISLKEEQGTYFFLDELHLQLNDEYTIKHDAGKDDANSYKTISYKKMSNKQGSLFMDLAKNGFEVKNYGYYMLDKDEENYVTLILERPLEANEYKKLMAAFTKWIDAYDITLELENLDGEITDVIEYEDLKKEVKKSNN